MADRLTDGWLLALGFLGTVAVGACGTAAPPEPGTSAPTTVQPRAEPLEVSGTAVGEHPFGTDDDEVLAAVTSRLGEPDLQTGPEHYVRIPGSDGWFEVAGDPISPGWDHPVVSRACWNALCLVFGGDAVDDLALRGWELTRHSRGPGSEELDGRQLPDVRLAGTGIRLGDTWERLHASYPDTVIAGAEGASVAVRNTPWPGIFDGAAAWRLSGHWDHLHPSRAPDDAVVTRLSGGEGPEPGCC